MAPPLASRAAGQNAACPAKTAVPASAAASAAGAARPPRKSQQLALLSLSAGALLAGGPGLLDAAPAAAAADLPAQPPMAHQAQQRISSSTTLKFPSVSAPQVRASDDGLMSRMASGPAVNYDDPDAYWDALEGGTAGAVPAPPPGSWQAVKYVEAAAPQAVGVLGDLADLNADVRNEASDYRDPAIAVPQDKLSGSSSNPLSGASAPDLSGAAESAKSAASDAKAKAKSLLSGSSLLPGAANSAGDLADLNADVRNEASDYRDPAIAVPQDKLSGSSSNPLSGASAPDLSGAAESAKSAASDAKAKAKSLLSGSSLLPGAANSAGDLATDVDVSSDVRPLQEAGTDTFQDNIQNKLSGGLSSTRTPNLGKAAKSAASEAKAKAKSLLSGSSLLPGAANSAGDLADLNADVRNEASDYRDPAIAVPQDKLSGSSSNPLSGASAPDLSGAAESAKSAASDAKAKAKSLLSGSSLLPGATNSAGDLADLNADVRNEASDYRDPAIALPQDKLSGSSSNPLSGASAPDLSGAAESAKSAASDAKAKAKSLLSGSSLLPSATNSVGDLADLNADVRNEASDYRDPAAVVQQDAAAGAASKAADKAGQAAKAVPSSYDSLSKESLQRAAKKPFSSPEKRNVGSGAGSDGSGSTVNDSAGVRRAAEDLRGGPAAPPGNARLSRPLVRDSLGQLRPKSVNQTGAAGGSDRAAKMAIKKAADNVSAN